MSKFFNLFKQLELKSIGGVHAHLQLMLLKKILKKQLKHHISKFEQYCKDVHVLDVTGSLVIYM